MGVPVTDWQFWVVTVAALGGVLALLRTVWPDRKKKPDGACPHCASGSAACAGKKSEPPADELVRLGGWRRS
jgi:hypothetical protein